MKKTARSKSRSAKGRSKPSKRRKATSRVSKPRARALKAKASPVKGRRDPRSAEDRLAELKRRLLEISDLGSAGAVLGWDEATYMPKGGAVARGRQSATVSRIRHERSIDPALGALIDGLTPYAEGLPRDSDDAALIRVARRDFEKAIKVPAEWVERASRHGSASYDAWIRARPANDFATMRPYLEKTLEFSREYAGFFAPYDRIARSADRRRRSGHDHGVDPEAVRGAAARAGADRARDRRPAGGRRSLPAQHLRRGGAAFVQSRCRLASWLRPQSRAARQDAPSVLHQVRRRRRADHHARARGRSRRRVVLDRARGRPRHVRAGRERRARRHAARIGRVGRRAREPVAAVGKRGRAQPRVLGAFLPDAPAALSRAVPGRCRSTPSIAPSTRWSAR